MKKIVVALDFIDVNLARQFVKKLDSKLCSVKVGKALFTAAGPEFIHYLHKHGFAVFLDLKFHDIPNTVKTACQVCASLGVAMLTVHTLGGLDMLLAAREGVDKSSIGSPLIMGVTVLTSMRQENLVEVGLSNPLNEQVLLLAGLANKAKLDGVVCSAHELTLLREVYNKNLEYLTPGIRLSLDNNKSAHHDQNRVMTPRAAIEAGSNYLVIGRAITQAEDPIRVLELIAADIGES